MLKKYLVFAGVTTALVLGSGVIGVSASAQSQATPSASALTALQQAAEGMAKTQLFDGHLSIDTLSISSTSINQNQNEVTV